MLNDLEEHTFINNHVNFHLIPNKKFKTVNFTVKFIAALDPETITKRALLTFLLQQGTKSYPSEKLLMTRLDELYGAVLSVVGQKKGNYHVITIRLEVANERYIEHETEILEKAIQLLKEVIYNPNMEDGIFPERIVLKEKNALLNNMEAIKDDKAAYANIRLIDHMCEGERFSTHTLGYEKDVADISPEDLSSYYQTMLTEDRMDIYASGDIETEEMSTLLKDNFKKTVEEITVLIETEGKNPEKVNEVIETQDVNQAKLHIGYRTNITYKDNEYFALHVLNGLFGGFPSSKLFMNVREKHSLAYYAASRIESHKGLLIVFCGIEAKDYQKARDIIDLQLEELKNGDFTDAEITDVKELIISEIKETMDHSGGLIELLYQQVAGNKTMPPNELIKQISAVTKEEVVSAANKLAADTVYLLTNQKEEE